MIDLKINQLEKIIEKESTMFVCGNGFSINFDNNFCNIHNRLYETNREVIRNGRYSVSKLANKAMRNKCETNYNAVIDRLRTMNKLKYYKIFDDGIEFAKSIVQDKELIIELRNKKIVEDLGFGKNQVHLLESISEVGTYKGAECVNLENWSILIYFYYGIKSIESKTYKFPKDNAFIKMIETGDKSSIMVSNSYLWEKTLLNGFNIYYRMIYSATIFGNGRAIDINKLDNIKLINQRKIVELLRSFKCIVTLNYDLIIEQLIEVDIDHLHGKYICNKKEFYYNQSLMLVQGNNYYSFSDILVGDYYMNKAVLKMVANMGVGKNGNKVSIMDSDIIINNIDKNRIDTVILFGLNIENDEDLIRYIIIALAKAEIKNPRIILSYYNKEEKNYLNTMYSKINKFGKEYTKYGEGIEIQYIKTHDILSEYFMNKT